jgi:hypothetical protein
VPRARTVGQLSLLLRSGCFLGRRCLLRSGLGLLLVLALSVIALCHNSYLVTRVIDHRDRSGRLSLHCMNNKSLQSNRRFAAIFRARDDLPGPRPRIPPGQRGNICEKRPENKAFLQDNPPTAPRWTQQRRFSILCDDNELTPRSRAVSVPCLAPVTPRRQLYGRSRTRRFRH